MTSVALYSDPPRRDLLALLDMPAVPHQGDVIVVTDDQGVTHHYGVHRVIWDVSPSTGGTAVNLLVHDENQP